MDRIVRVSLKRLLLDPNIYVRQKINDFNVSRMVQAVKSGVDLPPIICEHPESPSRPKDLDLKLIRVCEGWHRTKTFQQVFGDEWETKQVNAIFKKYANEYELMAESSNINAIQGLPLSETDKSHVLDQVVNRFGRTIAEGAKILGMTVERAEVLYARIVTITDSVKEASPSGEEPVMAVVSSPIDPDKITKVEVPEVRVPMKAPLAYLVETQNGKITSAQAEVNRSCLGVPTVRLCTQLYLIIDKNCLNTANERLLHELRKLARLIMEQPWYEEAPVA